MLKSVVTDIESVDEPLRALYSEREGGGYVLNVEPVDGYALENVSGLKTALATERTRHGDARRQADEGVRILESFRGIDPDAARAALSAVASGSVEEQVRVRVEALRAGIAETAGAEATAARAELEAARGTLAKREAQLQKLARDNVIAAELARVKPLDDAMDALVLVAGQHVHMLDEDGELVARVVDRQGAVRLDASGKPMAVRALMAEMREARPSLFQPTLTVAGLETGKSARGTGQSPGPNPWAKGQINITKQVAMEHHNPTRAAQLKAEAGVR